MSQSSGPVHHGFTQIFQPVFWHGVENYHALVFFGCWLGGIFDGMDSNLFSIMLPNAIMALAHTTDKAQVSQIGAWIFFVFLIGWTIGGIFFGWIGDRFGRVKSMIVSILLYAIFTGLAGLAQNIEQLALCRFLTGLGIGGELVSIATFLSETWPERSRAVVVGFLLTSYQVGVLLSGLITSIWSQDWRLVFLIGALPAILAVFLRTNLDESPKWQQQIKEAETTTHAPFREMWAFENRNKLLIGSLTFGALLIGYWASLSWIPTWIHDLLGPQHQGNEKSIAVIYHGIAAIVGCAVSGWLASMIGRKKTIMLSFMGCFAASAWLLLTNTVFHPVIYWQDAVLGFFIGLNQAVMYIYLPELFPTRIRATSVGFCLNIGRLSSAIAVLFVGVIVAVLGGYAQAAMVFAGSYLIGLVAIGFGPETRHHALPD